jgi:voltage-gated sodium channel|tara:strand:+ start:3115 stop:3996 length:882 start_codon:yes stop_codon:yes gene_type:complete
MSSFKNIQQTFLKIRNHDVFEGIVISIIIISAIMVGFRTYDEVFPPEVFQIFSVLDYAVTIFFLIEIIIRVYSYEKARDFFKENWNIFDFTIVALSLIPIASLDGVIIGRLLRVFRLLRLISFIPQFRILIESLITAIPRVGYVLLFIFIETYIFAAIGSILYSGIDPEHWGNIGVAMLTLFQTATLEGWPDLLDKAYSSRPFAWIFFLSFIILNSFIFLNMIVGVIIDVMIRQNDAYESEEMQALGKILRRIESVEKNVNTVKSNLGAEPYPIKDDSESQTAIDLEEKDDEI